MTPRFLHEPVTTDQQVIKLLRDVAQEDDHQAGKADFWSWSDDGSPMEWAAKDVAPMVDGAGGAIPVEVEKDRHSHASQL